jgi:hypothetical protein
VSKRSFSTFYQDPMLHENILLFLLPLCLLLKDVYFCNNFGNAWFANLDISVYSYVISGFRNVSTVIDRQHVMHGQ